MTGSNEHHEERHKAREVVTKSRVDVSKGRRSMAAGLSHVGGLATLGNGPIG
ncbi:MAG: hypothetical protein QNJ07_04710 [Woeseiaceae bacterium]|nr:hypothetical protein [Woeseiaceae bacterium]